MNQIFRPAPAAPAMAAPATAAFDPARSAAPGDPPLASAGRARWRAWWRERRGPYAALLLAFVASRLMLVLVGMLAVATAAEPVAPDLADAAGVFLRWDAQWYLALVEHGYSAVEHPEHPGQTLFGYMPAFPLLARALAWGTGWPAATAALALNNLLFLAALPLVHEYARLLGTDGRTGAAAGALICFAPQSFVFSAPYSESLFLLLSVAAACCLRWRHCFASGLLAAALSAVRVNGVFFAAFALCHVARRDGREAWRFWRRPERFAPVVLAPLGVFAFWWFSWAATGDAFAQSSTLRAGWGWSTGWPWHNMAHLLRFGFDQERFWVLWTLAAFGCSLLLLRFRWYEEFALCACSFALSWSGNIMDSVIRHSVVMFPVFVALAWSLRHRPAGLALLLLGLAAVNAALMAAWVLERAASL